MKNKNYKNDKEFLSGHLTTVELHNQNQRVLLTPDLQGRVLTSSANGEEGYSFGWLNYELIASGVVLPHCNNYGGEDRFWLGPEGGQFSIFFKGESGKAFDFKDWQAPALIDTERWNLVSSENTKVVFTKVAELENWSGSMLKVKLDRVVTLVDETEALNGTGLTSIPPKVNSVVFRSDNSITNSGDFEWTTETGMLSIWILGQFIPSETNTVIIPYKQSVEDKINDSYFGTIDADRLKVTPTHLLFKGDGGKRGKIGTPPSMTIPVAGAYDAINGTLTVVKFNFDQAKSQYVNSMWEYQNEPFKGDVINSYNDGPLEDGSIMGPFYEIETSSPAASLKPGEVITHSHTTMHFMGSFEELNMISQKLLDFDLKTL